MTDNAVLPVSTEHPLDQPYYGVGPIEAVKRFFKNYAVFSGRASRSEYWWSTLALGVIGGVLGLLALIAGAAGATTDAYGESQPGVGFIPFAVLLLIFSLAIILPTIAITVRRLHDINQSGLLYLINFVPYVGSIVLLVLAILPSKPEGARFDAPRA